MHYTSNVLAKEYRNMPQDIASRFLKGFAISSVAQLKPRDIRAQCAVYHELPHHRRPLQAFCRFPAFRQASLSQGPGLYGLPCHVDALFPRLLFPIVDIYNLKPQYCCFRELKGFLVGVVIKRALLFGVYTRASGFWKLPT